MTIRSIAALTLTTTLTLVSGGPAHGKGDADADADATDPVVEVYDILDTLGGTVVDLAELDGPTSRVTVARDKDGEIDDVQSDSLPREPADGSSTDGDIPSSDGFQLADGTEGSFDPALALEVYELDSACPWLLDLLQRLVDRSLLGLQEDGRLGFPLTVREFGRAQLVAPATVALRLGLSKAEATDQLNLGLVLLSRGDVESARDVLLTGWRIVRRLGMASWT